MIIGVKYFAKSASAPAPDVWTNLDVLSCYAWPSREQYDTATALDGNMESWRRKRYKITIVVGKLSMQNNTYRAVVEALLDSYYIKVKDTRFSFLPDAGTYKFIHNGGTDYDRSRPSNVFEDVTIELMSEGII